VILLRARYKCSHTFGVVWTVPIVCYVYIGVPESVWRGTSYV